MGNSELKKIDWEQLWENWMEPYLKNPKKNNEEVWNKKARNFDKMVTRTEYADNFIARMDLKPTDTILDIACGPGTLAVPLAKHVKSIIALDQSSEMLQIIQEKMSSSGIDNINCVHKNWEDTIIGTDFKRHDIVISSRYVSTRNLRNELLKLNDAALKYVYLTAPTENNEYQDFYRELGKAVGKPYSRISDYIYYYNILYQEGIQAHVDYIYYTNHYNFQNAEDAFEILNTNVQVENDEQKQRFMTFLENVIKKNGEFKTDMRCRWALIWWKKDEQKEIGGKYHHLFG